MAALRRIAPEPPTLPSIAKGLEKLMKETRGSQNELRILVTGKTGQGKSALTNGILGANVSVEGTNAARVTTEVEMVTKTIKGVPITVFDSPGLQDRTANEEEYIKGMKERCQELSLILYCTKMTNPRLTDDDKNAMTKLTKAFGENFWNYAVFVLTFANMENVERKDDRDKDEGKEPADDDEVAWKELKKRRFEGRLKLWNKELQDFLIKEIGVSPTIAQSIPAIPTGDRKKTRHNKTPLHLPDRDNWFNEFWEACCLRVKDTRLFLQINSSRMVTEDDDSNSEDEENDIEAANIQELFNPKTVQEKKDMFSKLSAQPGVSGRQNPPPKPARRIKLKTEAETGMHIPMESLLPPSQRKIQIEPPGGDLANMDIHIDRAFVEEAVEETVEQAGLDGSAARKIVEQMKRPVQWFKKIFKN